MHSLTCAKTPNNSSSGIADNIYQKNRYMHMQVAVLLYRHRLYFAHG